MDHGPWAMDHGRWTMGDGPWLINFEAIPRQDKTNFLMQDTMISIHMNIENVGVRLIAPLHFQYSYTTDFHTIKIESSDIFIPMRRIEQNIIFYPIIFLLVSD